MKKVMLVLIVFCCAMCASCGGQTSQQEEQMNQQTEDDIFQGELTWDLDLNDISPGTTTDFEVDQYLALKIGNAVLEKEFEVFYPETELVEVYDGGFFYYVVRMKGDGVPGMDINVAINKEDGKILKIWAGE